jgi:hypothetical protein
MVHIYIKGTRIGNSQKFPDFPYFTDHRTGSVQTGTIIETTCEGSEYG